LIRWIRKYWKNIFLEHSPIKTISSDEKCSESVAYGEELSRFVFSSKHIKKTERVVKAAAFLPNSDRKTSVFRKSRMLPEEYENKKIVIAEKRDLTIKAVALINASIILNANLQIEPEESEHKWHADIIGWPLDKDEQKSIAQVLAHSARIE